MTLQIPRNFGPVSKLFANKPVEDELSAGISTGFGRIGYAGKIWSTKYRGVEDKLMREDGDGPKTSIEVIILKSSTYKANQLLMLLADTADAVVRLVIDFQAGHRGKPDHGIRSGEGDPMRETLRMSHDHAILLRVLE